MTKVIIMRGLPASGKSTKAKELIEQDNTVRINKDLLRTMLHCDKFSGRNEGLTQAAANALAVHFLSTGTNVVIDDTNLNPKTVTRWRELAKGLAAKIEYVEMDTPIAECIFRDANREKRVGSHVIKKMALQYQDYLKGEKVVICDLDGTLCDITHRLHFAKSEPKDWKNFFDHIPADSMREEVLKEVRFVAAENLAKIIFVSARPENCRIDTQNWLQKHLLYAGADYEILLMREAGDKRPDTEVKAEIYERYLKNLNIIQVFDDRPSVIRMWREKGLDVTDVGSGVEF